MFRLTKKRLLLVVVFLIIVIGGFYLARQQKPIEVENSPVSVVTPNQELLVMAAVAETDLDEDGLKDWEEALWGTNPKLKDTDTDGTSDGEEVKVGRNPAKPGPKDAIDVDGTLKKLNAASTDETLNPTDKFSRDLFSTYINFKKSGVPIDQDVEDVLVKGILGNQYIEFTYRAYSAKEIHVSGASDKDTIKAYGNNIGQIINKYPAPMENELAILITALQTENEEEIKKLDVIISGYKGIVRDSLALAVPPIVSDSHLDLINSISRLVSSIETMRNVFVDPLSTYSAVEEYQTSVGLMFGNFGKIKRIFDTAGVSYTRDEPGYIFMIQT